MNPCYEMNTSASYKTKIYKAMKHIPYTMKR